MQSSYDAQTGTYAEIPAGTQRLATDKAYREPVARSPPDAQSGDTRQNASPVKVPKRKRLAKACDACHKSKRRCDGTAPCSNCYFASKACSYTDASGRPVPAPRAGHPSEDRRTGSQVPGPSALARPAAGGPAYALEPSTSRLTSENYVQDDQSIPRKRRRVEDDGSIPPAAPLISAPLQPGPASNRAAERSLELDASLTRELVNLFFTHCHPSRLIIHKPSFSASLSHDRIPTYLLYAMYALAAPLSKQPGIRMSPARLAGRAYFDEAVAMMFDGTGHLTCEPNLATAQALCLLQMHIFRTYNPTDAPDRYFDLALGIAESLGVYKTNNPVITPVPSAEFIHASIERECVRRVFWFIYFMDLVCNMYARRPIRRRAHDYMHELTLRLPCDETSFELASHATVPEYLQRPAPRARYASEFGHLIRITRILWQIEAASEAANVPIPDKSVGISIMESERALLAWASGLPANLQFTEQSLQLQLSMFETSSNTGAWCFCALHATQASAVIALNAYRQKTQTSVPVINQDWARGCLNQIISAMGGRAKNSLILAPILWPLVKYCKDTSAMTRELTAEFEDQWGVNIAELASWPPGYIDQNQMTGYPPHPTDPSGTFQRRDSDATPIDPSLIVEDVRTQQRRELPLLPSLKDSGLLDSWKPEPENVSLATTSSTYARFPPVEGYHSRPPIAYQPKPDPARSIGSGMPVGMPWLAHES